MTTAAMFSEFDLLWNNIMSNQAPGLSDSEKAVFLTKAQDEIVKNYLVPQSPGNQLHAGIEDIPKRQVDFKNLIKVVNNLTWGSGSGAGSGGNRLPRHHGGSAIIRTLPGDFLAILTETVLVAGIEAPLAVMPLTSGEFLRLMSKPYKYPLKGQCWRLMNENGDIEVIPPYGTTISEYILTYVKRPAAITGTSSVLEVPASIHEDIVQRAVEIAKAVWSSSDNFVAMGRRTE